MCEKVVADNLYIRRLILGKTLDEIAALAGVNPKTVTKYEAGKKKITRKVCEFAKVAKAYGYNSSDINEIFLYGASFHDLFHSISSNRPEEDNTTIEFINDKQQIEHFLADKDMVKLHYQNGAKHGHSHKNWGESKGEDHHIDVCVMLNKTTTKKRIDGKLYELPPSTKNKLYVAIIRARGNVYLINDF